MGFYIRKKILFVHFLAILFLGLLLLDQPFLQAENLCQSNTCRAFKGILKKNCKRHRKRVPKNNDSKKPPGVKNPPGADNAPDIEESDDPNVIFVSSSVALQQALNTDQVVIKIAPQITLNPIESSHSFIIKGRKDITILGGPSTFLDGKGLGTVLKIEDSENIRIRGIFFKNGKSTTGGGGIEISGNSNNIVFSFCTITLNTGIKGGGILIASMEGIVQMVSCLITSNQASSSGGGIFVDSSSKAVCNQCRISGNNALLQGGGLAVNGNTNIIQSTIDHNQAQATDSMALGGGIFIGTNGKVNINRTLIENNIATQGGGVFQSKRAVFNKTSSVVKDNIPDNEFKEQ